MTQEPIQAAGEEAAPSVSPSPREQSRQLLKQLIDAYPAAFFPQGERRIRPLKIGIHKDLRPAVKEWGYDQAALKIALSAYTRSLRYQYALLKEPHRVDLQGEAAGDITEENRQIAQEQIKLLQERREQRRQQQGDAAGASESTGSMENTESGDAEQTSVATAATAEQSQRPPRPSRPSRPPRERNDAAGSGERAARPDRPDRPERSRRTEADFRPRRGNSRSDFKMPPRDRNTPRNPPAPAESQPTEATKPASRERGVSQEALEALQRKFKGLSS